MLLSVSNCEVTIASVYGDCMESFSGLLDLLKSNGNDAGTYFARLREELGRLQVWAGNSGAHRSGSVSLDYRLRDASKVKRKVIELLEGLQQDLDDGNCQLFYTEESERADLIQLFRSSPAILILAIVNQCPRIRLNRRPEMRSYRLRKYR